MSFSFRFRENSGFVCRKSKMISNSKIVIHPKEKQWRKSVRMSRISTKPHRLPRAPSAPFAPVSSKVAILFSCNRVLGQPMQREKKFHSLLLQWKGERLPKKTMRWLSISFTFSRFFFKLLHQPGFHPSKNRTLSLAYWAAPLRHRTRHLLLLFYKTALVLQNCKRKHTSQAIAILPPPNIHFETIKQFPPPPFPSVYTLPKAITSHHNQPNILQHSMSPEHNFIFLTLLLLSISIPYSQALSKYYVSSYEAVGKTYPLAFPVGLCAPNAALATTYSIMTCSQDMNTLTHTVTYPRKTHTRDTLRRKLRRAQYISHILNQCVLVHGSRATSLVPQSLS